MKNVGITGYGYAGKYFHAYLISQAAGLQVSAIATRSPVRQHEAARDYPAARIYTTLDELIADEEIDLVVIATPHHTHHDLTVQAMAAGKHVVVDKIMCMNAQEAAEMIEVSRRNGVLLSVFHNRRWDGGFLTVQQILTQGRIGQPYLFEAAVMQYREPQGWRGRKAESGGILYDWPAHFVDQALQLVPATPQKVFCDVRYRDKFDTDIGNYAKLLIWFANKVLYQIEIANLAAAPKPRWYILGDEGSIVKYGLDPQEGAMRAGNIDAAEEDPAHYARVFTVVDGAVQEEIVPGVRGSWKSYYQNISDVLHHGAELAVKPEEIYVVMQVYDAAMQSAATGTSVWL